MKRSKILWFLYFKKHERRALLLLFAFQLVMIGLSKWPITTSHYELDEASKRAWLELQEQQKQDSIARKSVVTKDTVPQPEKARTANRSTSVPRKNRRHTKRDSIVIPVNKATVADWQQLYGIGPYYAEKICGFRDALGGFVNTAQIGETYALPDTVYDKIRSKLTCNGQVRQIPVNQVGAEALAKHPYLYWKEAELIVRFRTQRNGSISREEFLSIKGIERKRLEKVLPYLSFKSPDKEN